VTSIDNGLRNEYCGAADEHPKHLVMANEVYCDGVPRPEPFVELTVRASLTELFGEMQVSHEQALHLVGKYGLGMLIDCIGKPETAMVLRVRSGDGQDKVYPLISSGSGYKAVVDAPGF
jgi:hypothetical protein